MTPANVKTLIITIQSTPGQIQPALPFQGCPFTGRCICTPERPFSQVFSDKFSSFSELFTFPLYRQKIKGLSHVKEAVCISSGAFFKTLFVRGNEKIPLRKRKFQSALFRLQNFFSCLPFLPLKIFSYSRTHSKKKSLFP